MVYRYYSEGENEANEGWWRNYSRGDNEWHDWSSRDQQQAWSNSNYHDWSNDWSGGKVGGKGGKHGGGKNGGKGGKHGGGKSGGKVGGKGGGDGRPALAETYSLSRGEGGGKNCFAIADGEPSRKNRKERHEWSSKTGPKAQDQSYAAPEEEKADKIPKPMLTQTEADQGDFSGGKPTMCNAIPCDICEDCYPVPSAFVQCKWEDGTVANNYGAGKNIGLAKDAIAKLTKEFSNLDVEGSMWSDTDGEASSSANTAATTYLVASDSKHVCFRCYGHKFFRDENHYVNFKTMRLTSEWSNLRAKMKSKNAKENEIIAFIFKKAEEQYAAHPEIVSSLADIHEAILNKPEVGLAADWNPVIGDYCFIVFRCSGCNIAPLKQGKWLRFVKPELINTPGLSKQNGVWRCAAKYESGACLARFADTGLGMVLVFGDVDNVQAGGKYQIVLVGQCTARQKHVFTLLKAGKLLKKTEGKTDKASLLEAVEKLNEHCENRLMHFAECRNIRACTTKDMKDGFSWKPYCEDPRLSINNAGQVFKALYVPPETPTISSEDKDALLAALCSCYDLSQCKPGSKGELMAAWTWACEQRK